MTDYQPKTLGVRRLQHCIAAANKRRNRLVANGKNPSDLLCINVDAAKEAVEEMLEMRKRIIWLEQNGDYLYNHLNLLPPHMLTSDMKNDIARWNDRDKLAPKVQKR
jgi:hypothetical protein